MHESIRNQLQCVTTVEPETFDLHKIVIPKIMSKWEYIAYTLSYDIATTQAIKEQEYGYPKKFCQSLFKNWLITNNGAKPKVWSTLLDALTQLTQIDEISADITEDITAEVKQLNGGHEGYVPQGMYIRICMCRLFLPLLLYSIAMVYVTVLSMYLL